MCMHGTVQVNHQTGPKPLTENGDPGFDELVDELTAGKYRPPCVAVIRVERPVGERSWDKVAMYLHSEFDHSTRFATPRSRWANKSRYPRVGDCFPVEKGRENPLLPGPTIPN